MYDLVIIGAGPAGLSAAIYAIRKKLKVLVLSNAPIGGQITEAHTIENYLGIPSILGVELIEKFYEHAKKFNIEINEGVRVKKVEKNDDGFKILTDQGEFNARAIIAASGKKYKQLDVPGAPEFEGKGITYCATCDAPMFKNKTVAVVGGGDAGQDATWQLTKYANKIYLLSRYANLIGENRQLREQLEKNDRVQIVKSCSPIEVKGDKFVKSLVYKCNGDADQKEIAIDGIFVEIGSVPASEFIEGMVKLNNRGEIIIDPKTNMTSCPGIFAAGDVTDVPRKQMIVAAGEGAKAALGAYEYLKNK